MRLIKSAVALTLYLLCWMILSPTTGHSESPLPREFDSLVPVFKPSRPVDTRYTRQSVSVRFTSPEAYEQVLGFYTKALKKSGWKIAISDSGEKFVATKGRVILNLMEKDDIGGFAIILRYPKGRE